MLAALRRVRPCRGGAGTAAAAAVASSTRSLYINSRSTSTPSPPCIEKIRPPTVTTSAVHNSARSSGSLQKRVGVLGSSSAAVPTVGQPRFSYPRTRVPGGSGCSPLKASVSDCTTASPMRLSGKVMTMNNSTYTRSLAGSYHRAQKIESTAAEGNHVAMATYERRSGGRNRAGSSSKQRWLWTAAAVSAITAAAATSTATANSRHPPKDASAAPFNPDPRTGETTTTLVRGGCDCGCGGTASSPHSQTSCRGSSSDGDAEDDTGGSLSAIIAAAASATTVSSAVPPAAGAEGEGGSSAPRALEEEPLWQPSSSEARYGPWVSASAGEGEGAGTNEGGHRILIEEGGVGLDDGASSLRGGGKHDGQGVIGNVEDEDRWLGKTVPLAGRPLFTSVTSTKGQRPHMEDEFFLSRDGSFSAVYDGHGGANVSKYLRRNLYRHFLENLPPVGHDAYDVGTVERALMAAYKSADDYVTTKTPYANEGSCAVSVTVHCDRQGKASLISCNLGDSRAVLSRGGKALDLTEDHKPNAPKELERIYRHDGMVTWEGLECSEGLQIEGTGVYRINGNLAVARAIGDIDYRPWVSGEAEIRTIEINRETDQFVILASDGLWDVMTSEEAVQYVHSVMGGAVGAGREGGDEKRAPAEAGSGDESGQMTLVNWTQSYAEDRGMIRAATMLRKKKMARYLTAEALRRGSMDNTTVAVVWLQ